MIADLDETLRQLLIAEMPIKNGEINVEFDQPTREWSAKLTRPTLDFFLYDVRENQVLRQHQWQQVDKGNGHDYLTSMKRTPYRLDCFYMITSWAAEPEDEHRLLTRCLLALFRFPTLPEERLVATLQNPVFEIQARLARHDTLTNPAEVWSALDNELRPSVSYVITLALDPWAEVTGPIVRTLTLRSGQSVSLPRQRQLVTGAAFENSFIGGRVFKGKEPQDGIQVAIKGTGFFGTTDAKGQFSLGSLPYGDYTLIAWPAKGNPKQKKITVPSGDYDIDM
jgi:hypothetical protein